MDDLSVVEKGLTSSTYLSFMIDDEFVSTTYVHNPSGGNTGGSYWDFDVPIYVNQSVTTYGKHKLTILNGGSPVHSIFLFDYVIYTCVFNRGSVILGLNFGLLLDMIQLREYLHHLPRVRQPPLLPPVLQTPPIIPGTHSLPLLQTLPNPPPLAI